MQRGRITSQQTSKTGEKVQHDFELGSSGDEVAGIKPNPILRNFEMDPMDIHRDHYLNNSMRPTKTHDRTSFHSGSRAQQS
jgi:hypothetical protein